jgi:hypothetical protein
MADSQAIVTPTRPVDLSTTRFVVSLAATPLLTLLAIWFHATKCPQRMEFS